MAQQASLTGDGDGAGSKKEPTDARTLHSKSPTPRSGPDDDASLFSPGLAPMTR